MSNAIVSFFKSKIPQSVKWEELREEILSSIEGEPVFSDDNLIFDVNERYYKITVGKKTWYWLRENGKFDGESFDII